MSGKRSRIAAAVALSLLTVLSLAQPASAAAQSSVRVTGTQWHASASNCRTVYLRSNASFYWVAAEFGNDNRRLRARTNGDNGLGTWERFTLRGVGYDYTLLSSEGKYVSADTGGDGTLYARAPWVDSWEKFHIYSYYDVDSHNSNINITSAVNDRYVSADIGGDGTLRARATAPDLWEGFRIYLVENDAWSC
ncbi:hypothetical protein Q5425_33730 [Amycolatopsis sp. A133]|uniref:fascin domain-containing protein n=1 Tax=Amycolatopsis sp. A133 TaxID=3064472 RepID=UPI0027F64A8A|nr:hypothetical protein [Amycolatopsis sp. A133]MDQ7808722.1 hypothetical protein [Amycolatopsis sp. A133]